MSIELYENQRRIFANDRRFGKSQGLKVGTWEDYLAWRAVVAQERQADALESAADKMAWLCGFLADKQEKGRQTSGPPG